MNANIDDSYIHPISYWQSEVDANEVQQTTVNGRKFYYRASHVNNVAVHLIFGHKNLLLCNGASICSKLLLIIQILTVSESHYILIPKYI